MSLPAQWIAINDHASGSETHPNATRYHATGGEDGTNGPLKDLTTGIDLPVTLTISRSGFVLADAQAADPAPGTPMHHVFHSFADLTSTNAENLRMVGATSRVIYELSGLNPNTTYQFEGGAVVGSSFEDRYTRFSLEGAESFLSAHTAGVLTVNDIASIALNQAAMNTGQNHTPDTGDLFLWTEVKSGPDGTVSIVSQPYSGPLPGGSVAGNSGYALTALRITEITDNIPFILQQPENATVNEGEPHTFTVSAVGVSLSYQWLRDGMPIPNATNADYHIASVSVQDHGAMFAVIVSNPINSITSQSAQLSVLPLPEFLVSFSDTWRYQDTGVDPGPDWMLPQYDDSTWDMGLGPLGFEDGILPVPLATTLANHGGITYYFRSYFLNTNEAYHGDLVLTNMIDDGAVFYLNGEELARVRMPPGPVRQEDPASSTVSQAPLEVETLMQVPLSQGTNVFAVEVHQSTTSSGDLVFGASLTTTTVPLVITQQPISLSVLQGQPAEFSVEATGGILSYQWFKDGMPLSNETNSSLTIALAQFADEGAYHVQVTSGEQSLTSLEAFLTVMPLPPPMITLHPESINGSLGATITLLGEASGGEPLIFQWTKNGIPIAGATNESLTIDFLLPHDTGDYTFTVSNLVGTATSSNATLVVQADSITVLPFSYPWRYEANATDLGADWWHLPIPDVLWPHGQGPLGVEISPLIEPLRTALPLYSPGTYYFRTSFQFTGDPVDYQVQMNTLIDDGAVFYLNGSEIHRLRMPEGPVGFSTPASQTVDNALLEETTLPPGLLRDGINVLSVEVHQPSTSSSDIVMGLQLIATYIPPSLLAIVREPEDLTIGENQDAKFSLEVSGDGAHYQWFHQGSPIASATQSSLLLPGVQKSDSGLVWVVVSNSVNVVTSRQAMLTVTDPRPIIIVAQPEDRAILTGQPFVARAEVEGDLPWTFQWWHDGQSIAGATNMELHIPVTFPSNAGTYYFQAFNPWGNSQSDPFSLSILPAPRGPRGSLDTNFNSYTEGLIRDIAFASEGEMYVGGAYLTMNGSPRTHVARLHADGSLDDSFAPTVEGTILYSVAVDAQDRVLLGGAFSAVNGVPHSGIARLLPDGTLDPEFDAGSGIQAFDFPNIRDIAFQPDGRILLGGFFSSYRGVSKLNLVRILEDGTLDETFLLTNGPSDTVLSIALQTDHRILIGGRFTHVNGLSHRYVARLFADGTLDENFLGADLAPDDWVHLIRVTDDHILLGGYFTSLAGISSPLFARIHLDGTGTPDAMFSITRGSHPLDYVRTFVAQPYGHIFLAGIFGSDTPALNRIVRLNPDGSEDSTFPGRPGPNDFVWASELLPNGDILVGGPFTTYHGIPRGGLARIVGDSGPYLRMDATTDSSHYQLRWPTNLAEDLVLQSRLSSDSGEWESVVHMELEQTNGWLQYIVPVTNSSRFFQLRESVE